MTPTPHLIPNAHLAAGFRYNDPSEGQSATVWNVSGQYDLPNGFFVRDEGGTNFRLGVAVGLLMLLWCLSGLVMMYHGYPRLEEAERVKALQPLAFDQCCDTARLKLADDAKAPRLGIEMLGGHPVVRLRTGRAAGMIDLRTGAPIHDVDQSTAATVAAQYATSHGIQGPPRLLGLIAVDQWTLEGASRRGPVYHFRFGDRAVTDIHVAQRTGEAVQVANRADRILGWLGAALALPDAAPAKWRAVVAGGDLDFAARLLPDRVRPLSRDRPLSALQKRRWSPYRGWFYWRHYTGLFFGILTLTWVASGLFTMNPWGLFESPLAFEEMAKLQGNISGADLKRFIGALDKTHFISTARIDGAPLGERLYAVVTLANDQTVRLGGDTIVAPLTWADVETAIGPARIARLELLQHEDAF